MNVLFVSILLRGISLSYGWFQEYETRADVKLDDQDVRRFAGNDSFVDFFKILYLENSTALVGSINVIYNISLSDLAEISKRRITWYPEAAKIQICSIKGKSREDCHNYIQFGVKLSRNRIQVCGTNAYSPQIRTFEFNETGFHVTEDTEAKGMCPYSPESNNTFAYVDGELYSATVDGLEPLIYRKPLRTELSDLKQLNNPNFVSSFAHSNYVFFFFREAAVEYMNCGKVVYSRVARVCKGDKGRPHTLGIGWSSFTKARLNCSIPGEYPFYFNEIQGTSEIISGTYGSEQVELIYGIFTTPENSITASAICAFRMTDILKTFEGPFKGQEKMNYNWLPVPSQNVPSPRPGQCVNDSRTLPDMTVNFIKTHSLMDWAVPSFSAPIVVNVNLKSRFSALTVDPQVLTVSRQKVDVLFIGTDDGRVLKAVHQPGKSTHSFIEEIEIPNNNAPIKSLFITRLPEGPKLLVVTNEDLFSIELNRCSSKNTCSDCVEIQDPYCAWHKDSKICETYPFSTQRERYIQNITDGTNLCQKLGFPRPPIVDEPKRFPELKQQTGQPCPKCALCPTLCAPGSEPSTENIYTPGSLVMAVTTSGVVTFFLGFLFGFLCSKYFRPANAYSNMPLHTTTRLNRLNDSNGEGASYITSCANNKAAINLVVNVPPKNANDKNANSSSDNNKTLQKVKKTYI